MLELNMKLERIICQQKLSSVPIQKQANKNKFTFLFCEPRTSGFMGLGKSLTYFSMQACNNQSAWLPWLYKLDNLRQHDGFN